MSRCLLIVLVSLSLGSPLAPAAALAAAAALDADQIIARNVAARGGLERLRSLQSLRLTGRLHIPGGNLDITVLRVVQRGGSVRREFTLQGLTAVTAYDGAQAWKIDPFQGRKDPELMSADEAKGLILLGDLDSPLVDYRVKGHSAEYLGLEDVDGTPAFKLRLHLKSGDELLYFIDPDTNMIVRAVQKLTVRGVEQEGETDYGEYERVAGVYLPMSEQSGAKGSSDSDKQQLVFETAVANEVPPAGYFSLPAGKQAASGAVK